LSSAEAVSERSPYIKLSIFSDKSYHMFEALTLGTTHLQLYNESLRCKFLGEGKPYEKADFDKWFANYDAIVEIPQFFVEELIEFYPNAKYILVERDLNAWERSMLNIFPYLMAQCKSFQMNMAKHFEGYIQAFIDVHLTFEEVVLHSKGLKEGIECAKKDNISDSRKVKKLSKEGQLLACTLEGGFGWEQICPFLDKDIPETPYPRGNAPAEFQEIVKNVINPRLRRAWLKATGAVLVPVIGIAMFAYMKRR